MGEGNKPHKRNKKLGMREGEEEGKVRCGQKKQA